MMTMPRGRLVLWTAAAALVAALAWSFRPQPVPVDLAPVSRGALLVTIDEDGMTRVRERYVVSAPVAGRMQRVSLEPGDAVAANQIVATFLPATPTPLDPRARAEAAARLKAAQAARDQARVALERARDELAFARRELARYKEIEKFGGATDERLAALALTERTRDAQVKAAELALRTADHEVEAVQAVLQQIAAPARGGSGTALTLRSPIAGAVLRVHQESEALVPAGTPLIDVGNPDRLEVVADLLSTDAVRVEPGAVVRIDGWGGNTAARGTVRRVEPAGFTKISALGVEEQRVNVIVEFDDPQGPARALGDGYRVDVSIVISERSDVLKVPTSALFRVGEAWTVFAARDGIAAETPIQVGQRNAREAEVTAGLSEGDLVIVHPGDTIADGVRVTPREPAGSPRGS